LKHFIFISLVTCLPKVAIPLGAKLLFIDLYGTVLERLEKTINSHSINRNRGQIVKPITDRDRLVGALGGAGGALLFTVLLDFLFNPSWWGSIWLLNLSFTVIGASMLAVAVFLDLKSRSKVSKS
jgi:hypothetical protein